MSWREICDNFGKVLGKFWESFGKTLGKISLIINQLNVICGKVLGKLWDKLGTKLGERWGKRGGERREGGKITTLSSSYLDFFNLLIAFSQPFSSLYLKVTS